MYQKKKKSFSKILVLSFGLWVGLNFILFASDKSAFPTDGLIVIHTNSTNGRLRVCNSCRKIKGGLSRRAGVIRRLRKDKLPTLVVDAGDIFPMYPSELTARYTWRGIERIGYDTVGLGNNEFLFGSDFIHNLVSQSTVPVVCANVSITSGTSIVPLGKPYLRFKYKTKTNVLITSIVSSATIITPLARERLQGIVIQEPNSKITELVKKERKKGDLVIVLAHITYEEIESLAQTVSGIDLIVAGHITNPIPEPVKVNNTLIVQAGNFGEDIGILILYFDKNKQIVTYLHELVPLTVDLPDEPDLVSLGEEHDREVTKSSAR